MNPFDVIHIDEDEFNFIMSLPKKFRFGYLCDLYDMVLEELDAELVDNLDVLDEFNEIPLMMESFSTNLDNNTQHRVDVVIDRDNIVIESDNLSALRIIKHKFISNGFILQRNKLSEKLFLKDKLSKYLQVFSIINQTSSLCYN